MRVGVLSLDGSQCVQDSVDATVQADDEATALGLEMAARLVNAGADVILKKSISTGHPRTDSNPDSAIHPSIVDQKNQRKSERHPAPGNLAD